MSAVNSKVGMLTLMGSRSTETMKASGPGALRPGTQGTTASSASTVSASFSVAWVWKQGWRKGKLI